MGKGAFAEIVADVEQVETTLGTGEVHFAAENVLDYRVLHLTMVADY